MADLGSSVRARIETDRFRADDGWLRTLESCTNSRFRSLVRDGGEPLFVLSADSKLMSPVWVLLVRNKSGDVLRVTTETSPLVRKLTSIRQVYQVARSSGLTSLTVPVDC